MPPSASASTQGTKVIPLTVKLAVVAGSNLAGAGSLFFVWWLRSKGLLGDTPLWFLFVLILGSLPLDVASKRWLQRNRRSRLRVEVRVATSVAITASVIYAAGWGAVLSIAFALC